MVPRNPAPDGKRIPLSVEVSEAKVAEIDAARGDMTRAVWLAAAIDRHLEPTGPTLPPDGFEDLAAVAQVELQKAARADFLAKALAADAQVELQKAARADFLAKALPPRRAAHAVTCRCGVCRPSR